MTKTARIAKALLNGEVLTIMDGFTKFKVTNLPREISRQIEQKFEVVISRDRVDFTADCGTPGCYYRYRLNHTENNKEGIEKMRAYVNEFFPAMAQFLVKNLGKKEAVAHVTFVLSYEYGLSKEDLRVFWTKVKELIKEV